MRFLWFPKVTQQEQSWDLEPRLSDYEVCVWSLFPLSSIMVHCITVTDHTSFNYFPVMEHLVYFQLFIYLMPLRQTSLHVSRIFILFSHFFWINPFYLISLVILHHICVYWHPLLLSPLAFWASHSLLVNSCPWCLGVFQLALFPGEHSLSWKVSSLPSSPIPDLQAPLKLLAATVSEHYLLPHLTQVPHNSTVMPNSCCLLDSHLFHLLLTFLVLFISGDLAILILKNICNLLCIHLLD